MSAPTICPICGNTEVVDATNRPGVWLVLDHWDARSTVLRLPCEGSGLAIVQPDGDSSDTEHAEPSWRTAARET